MDQDTSMPAAARPPFAAPAVLGIPVVSRIRRLVVVALVSSLVYGFLMTASKGYCPGGVAPTCIQLNLVPSPLVHLAIAILVLSALGRVISRARDLDDAFRILDRAATATAIVVAASIVISHVWFWSMPITDWGGAGGGFSVIAPFPFGFIDVVTSRIPG